MLPKSLKERTGQSRGLGRHVTRLRLVGRVTLRRFPTCVLKVENKLTKIVGYEVRAIAHSQGAAPSHHFHM